MQLLIRSYHTVELQDFQKKINMCYFIIERQLNIEYITVVALFVLQKLEVGLKMMSNFLQKSERQLFWELVYGH